MTEDIRRMYCFKNDPPDDQDYIKSLYIKSDYKFEEASEEIEYTLKNFRTAIKTEQLRQTRARKPSHNLPFRK